jgi:hypothetical protein
MRRGHFLLMLRRLLFRFMLASRGAKLRAEKPMRFALFLHHIPIPLLGIAIAVSAVQASCGGSVDQDVGESATDAAVTDESVTDAAVTDESATDAAVTDESATDAAVTDESATDAAVDPPDRNEPIDAPSQDSADDRADGMRYGDGYSP